MQKDRNIALFIDVDNCNLEFSHFDNTIVALKDIGNVLYGKVYGVSDRKNKEIIDAANNLGFDTAVAMRIKKRGSRVFDNRIMVDVMDTVLSYSHIDTVCIIAAPSDMVHLYSKLHTYGIKILAMDNLDDESTAFVDQAIDIGYVEPIKPISKKRTPSFFKKKEVEPAEVENLSATKVEIVTPEVTQQPVQPENSQPEEIKVEEVAPQPEEIQQDQTEQEQPVQQPIVEEVVDLEPPVEQKPQEEPSQINVGGNDEDVDILRQIEKVKSSQSESTQDDEALLAEIKRLLAEFKTDAE